MKILIAYDGSEFAKAILNDLRCAGLPPRAEVAVVTLAEPEYFLVGKKPEGIAGWLSHRLIEARSSARFARDRIQADFPGWDVTLVARLASPAAEILRKVVEWKPDLVIVGQHGCSGLKCAGLGRVAKQLFKEARCSVRIAREHTGSHDAPPRIIIPLAASQNLEVTARAVTSRQWPPGTEVKLLTTLGPTFSEMQLACGVFDAQTEAAMKFQWPIEQKLLSANLLVSSEITAGFPATDVIETASRWRADCVFIGAEEMSFIERMFCGAFVTNVATRAECSVEVVRGPIRRAAAIYEFPVESHHKDSLPLAS